jgi:hypothetical protein
MFGTFLKEVFGAFFGALLDRFFPKKTANEQKQEDIAHSATAALAVERKINEADESSPTTLEEAVRLLREGKG